MNAFGGGNAGEMIDGSAISGFATDRRPIKMRNFGMLKGVGASGQ